MKERKPERELFKYMLKASVLLIAFMVLFSHLSVSAYAEGSGQITVQKWPVEGTAFHLYKLADYENGSYAYADAYQSIADKPADSETWNTLNAQQLQNLAEQFLNTVQANNLQPVKTGNISNGSCTFSGLDEGLYLLIGDDAVSGSYRYTSQPSLIPLPAVSNGVLSEAIEVDAKYAETEIPRPTPKTTPVPEKTPAAVPTPESSTSTSVPGVNPANTSDEFHAYGYVIMLAASIAVIAYAAAKITRKSSR